MRAPAAAVVLSVVLFSSLAEHAWALRGPGLPYRQLFSAPAQAELPGGNGSSNTAASKSAPAAASPPANTTTTATGAGLTMAGLTTELEEKAEALRQQEHRHSKATTAVAATLGGLLLAGMLAVAGLLVWRRFQNSQHARKKGAGPNKLPYYDADRLLGDSSVGL